MSIEFDSLIDKVERLAAEYEMKYHGCSQCVVAAIQEGLGLSNKSAFKAATGLAGGVARMGETCGALLGGIISIGIIFGRDMLEDSTTSIGYQKTMQLSSQLCNEFINEFGTTRCRDIQMKLFGRSFNLNDPEQRREFVLAGAYNINGCPSVVRKAARIATKIIIENLKTRK
ncbi:MAG: C-GCAxxG-C-C family protein [Nitrososphaerota archaeon]